MYIGKRECGEAPAENKYRQLVEQKLKNKGTRCGKGGRVI